MEPDGGSLFNYQKTSKTFILHTIDSYYNIKLEVAYMIFNYSYSYKHNTLPSGNPVDVIVNFATDGRYIPIYFKYMGKDDAFTFKIDGIHYTKDRHDSKIFCCYISHNNVRQEVFLKFLFNECTWVLGEG